MNNASSPDLTPVQRSVLAEFKTRIEDVLQPDQDDFHLIKWLRARNWNAESAEKMFRSDKQWRAENGVDAILSSYEPPEVLVKYYPGGCCGVTKDGYAIWMELIAWADQRGLYQSVSQKEMIRFMIWRYERFYRIECPELSRKYGKRIDQCVKIVDSQGFGLKHLWKPAVDAIAAMAKASEEHYPDTFHSIIAINLPSVLPFLFSVFKPFLSANTRSKIRLYAGDYKQRLLENIDADQLPVHWGGTATDPDGDTYCRSKVCIGGTIPEKYYRRNLLKENMDLSRFTSVTVQRGSTLQLDFQIKAKNSLLSWNFYTDDSDIGFGVYRRTSLDPMEAVLPSERVQSHVIPESGNIVCDSCGTYVVRFDNKFSWLNSKKLFYLIEVIEPQTEEPEISISDSTPL